MRLKTAHIAKYIFYSSNVNLKSFFAKYGDIQRTLNENFPLTATMANRLVYVRILALLFCFNSDKYEIIFLFFKIHSFFVCIRLLLA